MYESFEYANMYESPDAGLYEDDPYAEGFEGETMDGFDYELTDPFEGENADPFLGGLVSGLSGALSGPLGGMLKGLAGRAAVAAGRAIGGPQGAQIAGSIADRVLREQEMGGDFEASSDFEAQLASIGGDMGVLREMAQLSGMAAQAGSPRQADQFLGAIASLAGNLLPGLLGGQREAEEEGDEFFPALLPLAKMALPHVLPLVQKGIQAIGRSMEADPTTRPAAVALPPIAAKTVTSLAKQAQAGKKIDKKAVVATLAKAATKTLASKPALANAIEATKAVTQSSQANQEVGAYRSGYGGGYGSPSYSQPYGQAQGRRIIRPRYCVY
jgi:hypothetical protein